jgi:hypothetical protein
MSDPELFVVRVWRQLAGSFHASARRVDDEQTRHFSQPDELTRYLSAAADGAPDPAEPATASGPDSGKP